MLLGWSTASLVITTPLSAWLHFSSRSVHCCSRGTLGFVHWDKYLIFMVIPLPITSVTKVGEVHWDHYVWLSVFPAFVQRISLNCSLCKQTSCGSASSWARVSCQKHGFAVFKVTITATACIIKILLFLLYYLNSGSFTSQTLLVHHYQPEHLLKILDFCVEGQGSKFQLIFGYCLNHWTFCNQTWYGDPSSKAWVVWHSVFTIKII